MDRTGTRGGSAALDAVGVAIIVALLVLLYAHYGVPLIRSASASGTAAGVERVVTLRDKIAAPIEQAVGLTTDECAAIAISDEQDGYDTAADMGC